MRLLDNYRHSYVVVWCVEVLVIHVYSTISPHINGQDTKLHLSCLFLHRRSPKILHWFYQVYSWCACSVRDVACVWFSASDQLRFTSCYRREALASSRWEGHIRGRLEEDWEDVPIVPNSESCANNRSCAFSQQVCWATCSVDLFAEFILDRLGDSSFCTSMLHRNEGEEAATWSCEYDLILDWIKRWRD